MGYDTARFKDEVDDELLCPICTGVLEDPVQAEKCEHSFCRGCIGDWLSKHPSCPIDRGDLTKPQLKPVPRILRNLLSKLQVNCDHMDEGCGEWLKLDSLEIHLKVCDFNPKKPIQCDKGCKLMHMKCETQSHDCIKELRVLLDETKVRHRQSEERLEKQNDILLREIDSMQEENHALSNDLQALRSATNTPADDTNWVTQLDTAKVSRWGGIISTPDQVLKTVIKRALLDSRCPLHITNQLIANSHEKEWPPGLKTLEARQLNRRMYQTYVAKRIPYKQAVVVMECDNEHMANDFMLKPGLLFVFAQGVE